MNNSFRIEKRGPRAEVIEAVKAAHAAPKESDQTAIEAEKVSILARIKALPETFTGVNVLAIGDGQAQGSETLSKVHGYVIPVEEKHKPK